MKNEKKNLQQKGEKIKKMKRKENEKDLTRKQRSNAKIKKIIKSIV